MTKNPFQKHAEVEKKARAFGLEWNKDEEWIKQVASELEEVKETLDQQMSRKYLEEELGDLLHAAVSLCYHHNIDAEKVFNESIDKFKTRYEIVVEITHEKNLPSLKGQNQEIITQIWKEAKKRIKP